MKVTRRQLKSIIREFLDTSVRPTAQKTSAYDQATNSERAAFISAMGIADKASEKGKVDALQEAKFYQFPTKKDPLDIFKQQVADANASQEVVDPDGDLSPAEIDEYDLEDEVEDLLDAATGRAGENVAVLGHNKYEDEYEYEDEDEDEDDYIPPELRALM